MVDYVVFSNEILGFNEFFVRDKVILVKGQKYNDYYIVLNM